MIQSFEIWCDFCLKTKYYDELKAVNDESFIKINDSMLAKKPIKTIKLALLLPKTSQTISVIRNVNG